jgi:hypothetical protein
MYYLINYAVQIESQSYNPRITVSLATDQSRIIWKSNSPFVWVNNCSAINSPVLNGNYQFEELYHKYIVGNQTIDTVHYHESIPESSLQFIGSIFSNSVNHQYSFTLSSYSNSTQDLRFSFHLTSPGPDTTCTSLSYFTDPGEGFYGFGESFSYLNLRGRVVPLVVSEQGVGRGVQPLTDYFNFNVSEGAGGDW